METCERLTRISRPSANGSARLRPKSRESATNTLLTLFHRLRKAYGLAIERSRQRRQLLEMDDHQLKDIGITRAEAELEGRKPIWKA
jgi:uncharacterized protein YjiS (DUF1127 family)